MPRPRKNINEAEIERWASVGASVRLIADLLGVPESTIRSRYRAKGQKRGDGMEWKPGSPLAKGYARDRARLLVAIADGIKKGQPALIIFSAKNKLGMSDSPAAPPPDDMPDQLPPKQG